MKRLRDVVCDFKQNQKKIQRMDSRYHIEPLYRTIRLDRRHDGAFITYFEKPPHLNMDAWLKELDPSYIPYKNGVLPFTDEEKARMKDVEPRLIAEYEKDIHLRQTKEERMARITGIPDWWVPDYRVSIDNKHIQFGFVPGPTEHDDDPLVRPALRKLKYKSDGYNMIYPKTDEERARIDIYKSTIASIRESVYNMVAEKIERNIQTPRKTYRDKFHIQIPSVTFADYHPRYRMMDFIRNVILHGDKSMVIERVYEQDSIAHIVGHVDFSKIN